MSFIELVKTNPAALKKTWVALVTALGIVAPLLEGGLTIFELVAAFIAFSGAFGVYQVRNDPAPGSPHIG